MRVPQGAPAVVLCNCVLLMICSRLDKHNLHARLMTAEHEVAPRDVLEHVREVVDHGRAGLAPTPALARLLVGRVAAEAVEEHGPHARVARPHKVLRERVAQARDARDARERDARKKARSPPSPPNPKLWASAYEGRGRGVRSSRPRVSSAAKKYNFRPLRTKGKRKDTR